MYNLSSIPGFNDLLKTDDVSNLNILKLNKIECKTLNSTYRIIRYDKNILSHDLTSSYGLCRSVILNINNEVISFAPPKSILADTFIKKYPNIEPNIVAEEFIEGTMINLFFDKNITLTGNWEISTRNKVGALCSFYETLRSKTFREMFTEAAIKCNLDFNKLNKELCYSFVLQHPENRIVIPFSSPDLYLVAVYKIHNELNNVNVENYDVKELKNKFNQLYTYVKFPTIYKFNKYSELIEKYGSMNTYYDIVGVIIHNTQTGERTKIRNPVYEQVRNLRGNQPKLQYQYLCLRKEEKVNNYLNFYPENKSQFSEFRYQLHLFTKTLYNNYVDCYIKKQKPLFEYSQQYKTHMFNIHQIYMNELREKKRFVTKTIVQEYVNKLHPSLLMYSLNYQLRKNSIDIRIANNIQH